MTGWAACRLHRAAYFDGLDRDGATRMPVPLALGAKGNIRAREGIRLSYDRLDPTEVVLRDGVPATTVLRAAFDAVRWSSDVREAVVALDMLAAAKLTTPRRVAAYAGEHHGWRGADLVLQATPLATEHSRSPQETRLGLIARLDAGIEGLLMNCPVHGRDGRLLGIADLLEESSGLVVEFDGAEHRKAARQASDLRRDDDMESHGLVVARVSGPDLHDRVLVVGRIARARDRAVSSAARRLWVARPLPDDLDWLLDRRDEVEARLARDGGDV